MLKITERNLHDVSVAEEAQWILAPVFGNG
jgi:hypothetical protein